MTESQIHAAIAQCLAPIAPEADLSALDPKANLRESLDLDSFDFLQFLIALSHQLRLDIPEADYSQLASLHDMTSYLAQRLPLR
ncbi:MAG: acyl carrier protein [Verrucomicrobiales bacterium]